MPGWMQRFKSLLTVKEDRVHKSAKRGKPQQNKNARKKAAANPKTSPDELALLARDADADIRMEVVKNPATPVKARAGMCKDSNADIRMVLAGRMVELMPSLSEDQHSELYAFAVQALGVLAHDEVLKVRRALASALRDYAQAPPQIVNILARDIERQVAEPILRYCVALSDDDMLDILSHHPEPWVIAAIAKRDHVSENVSEGVFQTLDNAANTALLENEGADIANSTLSRMVARAREFPDWQAPLAVHKRLSAQMAKDLADIAGETVLRLLSHRDDFDEESRQDIADITRRRLKFLYKNSAGENGSDRDTNSTSPAQNKTKTPKNKSNSCPPEYGPAIKKAKELLESGKLNDAIISDAIAMNDHDFLIPALSVLSRLPMAMVEHIIDTNSPKAVISLFWLSGLSMRNALEMQKSIPGISPKDIVYARDGLHYPYPSKDMIWQLEFFGIDNPIPRPPLSEQPSPS